MVRRQMEQQQEIMNNKQRASAAAPSPGGDISQRHTSTVNHRLDLAKLVAASAAQSNDFFKQYHLLPGFVGTSNHGTALSARGNGWLGEGGFSICYRCVHRQSGQHFAVKIFKRLQNRDPDTGQLYDASLREVHLLHQSQGHPNIVKLEQVFHDETHTFIVLELLLGGELLGRIRQRRFSEAEAWVVFHQLVAAVQFLHSQGIVHRDIKPVNVIFADSSNEKVKLVDFGLAQYHTDGAGLMRSASCTPKFAAPEVLHQAIYQSKNREALHKKEYFAMFNAEGYGSSCDLWGLGVVLLGMLTGRIPFNGFIRRKSHSTNAAYILEQIKNGGEFNFEDNSWNNLTGVSPLAKSVVEGLLKMNPYARFSMRTLIRHPWMMNAPTVPLQMPLPLPQPQPAPLQQQQHHQQPPPPKVITPTVTITPVISLTTPAVFFCPIRRCYFPPIALTTTHKLPQLRIDFEESVSCPDPARLWPVGAGGGHGHHHHGHKRSLLARSLKAKQNAPPYKMMMYRKH